MATHSIRSPGQSVLVCIGMFVTISHCSKWRIVWNGCKWRWFNRYMKSSIDLLVAMMLHLHDFQLNFSATFHIPTQHAGELHSAIVSAFKIWNIDIGQQWMLMAFNRDHCSLLAGSGFELLMYNKWWYRHWTTSLRKHRFWPELALITLFGSRRSVYKRRAWCFTVPHINIEAQRIQIKRFHVRRERCSNGVVNLREKKVLCWFVCAGVCLCVWQLLAICNEAVTRHWPNQSIFMDFINVSHSIHRLLSRNYN